MPVRLTLRVDLQSAQRLIQRIRERLPEARRQLIDQAAGETLNQVVQLNPVDTGRSRAAWVRALEQLGRPIPPGWQGPHPDPAALREGVTAAGLQRTHTDHHTDVRITNSVSYVPYLEYGTRFTPPRAMLRRALNELRNKLSALLRALLNGL